MKSHRPGFPAPVPLPARRGVLLGAASAAILLAGCAAPDDTLAAQAKAGDNKNYIAGDGSVSEYATNTRGAAVEMTGKLFDGSVVSSTDWKGTVTVLNVWYAACAPCRKEAPDLEALHQEFKTDGVRFYGINVRDTAATAAAFARTFGTTYPSINDADGGVLLALADHVPPRAVPTTLVLDKQGKVSARVLGLAEKGTLKALVSTALQES
ncbi:TlpA disulfide reductase family protein [Pseudarthrobacter sp. H3Y2-7]|uniref:TlpA family protein disulfide reductase n=1 Tax=Pseudarthrobacter naphthalenicus TaxID=3031328 RepID=UPI0023AF9C0B|nr:TlpA disulfide reductase family protein [Pseudarthrobacter sp. H3Y2-7]MDE8669998.1 TlpA disulfide reductase family protein [Pseudarthrobacter sp. H3Y2-7]